MAHNEVDSAILDLLLAMRRMNDLLGRCGWFPSPTGVVLTPLRNEERARSYVEGRPVSLHRRYGSGESHYTEFRMTDAPAVGERLATYATYKTKDLADPAQVTIDEMLQGMDESPEYNTDNTDSAEGAE